MRHNPTVTIKCTFSNEVHKILEPNIDIKTRQRWNKTRVYSDKEKLEMFEKILALHKQTSSELTAYQYDKRNKKRIQKARIERGVPPKAKKRVSKEQYENSRVLA